MKQLYLDVEEEEGLGLTRQGRACCSLHSEAGENIHKTKVVKVEGAEDSQAEQDALSPEEHMLE